MCVRVGCLVYRPASTPAVTAIPRAVLFELADKPPRAAARVKAEKASVRNKARKKIDEVSDRATVIPLRLVIGTITQQYKQLSFCLGDLGDFAQIEDFLAIEADLTSGKLFSSPAGEA